jgi:hypothetical protein
MARSRYATTPIDGDHYETWTDPTRSGPFPKEILAGVDCVDHVLSRGERLDSIANTYYGEPELWWVIAMSNRIVDPFSISPGMTLRVPIDVRSILERISR